MAVKDYETAMHYLEQAVATNFPQQLVLDFHFESAHPDFDPIRPHPRFDELVQLVAAPVSQSNTR